MHSTTITDNTARASGSAHSGGAVRASAGTSQAEKVESAQGKSPNFQQKKITSPETAKANRAAPVAMASYFAGVKSG